MILEDFPECDCNPEHVGTIHCPQCEENFCLDCDQMVHSRKKYRDHVRDPIQIVEPEPEPVPCDSDPTHQAVMFCEDCEENLCDDCDRIFHSRKKTANHLRYEGARKPEVIEALKREAEAEAAAAAQAQAQAAAEAEAAAAAQRLEELRIAKQKQTQPTTASPVSAATAGKKELASQLPASGTSTATRGSATPTSTAGKAAATPNTNTAAAAPKSTTPVRPNATTATKPSKKASSPPPRDPLSGDVKDIPSSKDRVAEHKAAWNDLRLQYCKKTYNVGHWLGLTTDERKELAVTLCKELLFNPPSTVTDDSTVDVTWNATSYWTTYEVDIECVKTVTDTQAQTKSVTSYKVHIDDTGRLADFEILTNGQPSGCNIM